MKLYVVVFCCFRPQHRWSQ